ncbi:hypothetical protein CEUSTIGMA_g13586.t1 [Chlamydomonas eustigma]|uniref:Uncharacterized protein n=1 Tax=Chlamydomonas eustigma TaxID=1157962 RepID=A0A250XFZ9_9CHLO|nr:hypothetical protein CEUSTIGMA_g9432.t1 [Chlamydomonas eustigma]GAX86173.1 hypothetical protein CEUSTIGMA_g13586.t1 [Chlamydomonas eustigma]|eukprot:GAX82004.1 hypothetical protein CEUSTIGMA_g9432.t1 [Chlamydomonas eustigma]
MSENLWEWGQHYQVLDVPLGERSNGSLTGTPAICRIDRLLKLDGALLRLCFTLTQEEHEDGFAEVALYRRVSDSSKIYQHDNTLSRIDARYYPDKHVVKGNILVSCALLGRKVQVESVDHVLLQVNSTDTDSLAPDLTLAYLSPKSRAYYFQSVQPSPPDNKQLLCKWSEAELQAELRMRGRRSDGCRVALLLRLMADSILGWFGIHPSSNLVPGGHMSTQRSHYFVTSAAQGAPTDALTEEQPQREVVSTRHSQQTSSLSRPTSALPTRPVSAMPTSSKSMSKDLLLSSRPNSARSGGTRGSVRGASVEIGLQLLMRYGLHEEAAAAAAATVHAVSASYHNAGGRPASARPSVTSSTPFHTARPHSAMAGHPTTSYVSSTRKAAMSRPSTAVYSGSSTTHHSTARSGIHPPRPHSTASSAALKHLTLQYKVPDRPASAVLYQPGFRHGGAGLGSIAGNRPSSAYVPGKYAGKGRKMARPTSVYGISEPLKKSGTGWGQFESLLGISEIEKPPAIPSGLKPMTEAAKKAREACWEISPKIERRHPLRR